MHHISSIVVEKLIGGKSERFMDRQILLSKVGMCEDQPFHIDSESPILTTTCLISQYEHEVENSEFVETLTPFCTKGVLEEVDLKNPTFNDPYFIPWSSHQPISKRMVDSSSINFHATAVIHRGKEPNQNGVRTLLLQNYNFHGLSFLEFKR